MRRSVVLGLALSCPLALAAEAAPLSKDECDTLKSEQTGLVSKGVRAEMERGAGWAKANLDGARMKLVARLIEVDEQILFRCGARQAAIAEETEPAGTGAGGKPEATPASKAGETPGSAAASGQAELKPQAAEPSATKPKRSAKPKQAAKPEAAKPATAAPDGGEAAQETAVEGAQSEPPPPKKKRAAAKPKSGDAYVPPEGAPESVLQAPAASEAAPAKVQ